ncbi:MFS transporter, SP family, galactose:H+ symporter [Fistulifera solaris]|uniref:Hexose transporter 1 n=1 Tax=Fistulifera solaris TaxID=1519565 RepID=A0A1Z5K6F0_FISSO|nr:MFS transporter, SP family, galactose:H+ symporter [Fistulifera solaris]|eukprot:GAX21742.1 MFS transporter, SP family, galactose:H+ symporter [Fistulifera solaris]
MLSKSEKHNLLGQDDVQGKTNSPPSPPPPPPVSEKISPLGDGFFKENKAIPTKTAREFYHTESTVTTTTSYTTSGLNRDLKRLVIIAAATAATLGYDVGIMAAAIQPLQAQLNLTSVQKEFAMGSLNFVAAAGALLGGNFANGQGRKPTIQLCGWLFIAGTLLMALAPDYWVLLLGRIVTGLGVGVSFVVAPVFLSEVAPTDQRGSLNTVFDVAINGGILMGYIVGFLVELSPIPDDLKWRVMLGMGILLPILVLYNLALLPESPRYLVMKNQPDEAHQVLEQLGSEDAASTVASIQDELDNESSATPGFREIISNVAHLSVGMKLALGLGFWQQVTGTEAVLYYSADFLEQAGLASPTQRLLGNCFVGLCKLTPELIAMRVVDRIGRRPLMLGSALSLCISTFLLGTAFFFSWSPVLVVLLLCAVMASFSLGLGPFTFLVASEMLGLSERATGMTLCAAVNRSTSGLVALTAVSLNEALGGSGFFFLYAMIGFVSLPYYSTQLPETSGVSLEELAARNRGEVGIEASPRNNTLSKIDERKRLGQNTV